MKRGLFLQDKGKIDYSAKGLKDCADVIAGVVYVLQTKEATYGQVIPSRKRL